MTAQGINKHRVPVPKRPCVFVHICFIAPSHTSKEHTNVILLQQLCLFLLFWQDHPFTTHLQHCLLIKFLGQHLLNSVFHSNTPTIHCDDQLSLTSFSGRLLTFPPIPQKNTKYGSETVIFITVFLLCICLSQLISFMHTHYSRSKYSLNSSTKAENPQRATTSQTIPPFHSQLWQQANKARCINSGAQEAHSLFPPSEKHWHLLYQHQTVRSHSSTQTDLLCTQRLTNGGACNTITAFPYQKNKISRLIKHKHGNDYFS